ncbi:hypothetical protein RF11_03319 [Thelohanellus kitauei]|uniref:Uncharacterized protein n=1 Tax=Thelohanellus kitauei TaxID=669202 RepID=A0A0C2NL81_THEKT|nr:hypothetical protein RF11_03319 [Thelohanellus kitauei]
MPEILKLTKSVLINGYSATIIKILGSRHALERIGKDQRIFKRHFEQLRPRYIKKPDKAGWQPYQDDKHEIEGHPPCIKCQTGSAVDDENKGGRESMEANHVTSLAYGCTIVVVRISLVPFRRSKRRDASILICKAA